MMKRDRKRQGLHKGILKNKRGVIKCEKPGLMTYLILLPPVRLKNFIINHYIYT